MYDRFELPNDWKNKPSKIRCMKLILYPNTEQQERLNSFYDNARNATNYLSREVCKNLLKIDLGIKKEDEIWKDPEIEVVFQKRYNIYSSNLNRSITRTVRERYKGIKRRFRKKSHLYIPKNPFVLKQNKAIQIIQGNVDIKDGTIKISLDGKSKDRRISIPSKIIYGEQHKHLLKLKPGGYLSKLPKNRWLWTIKVNIPFEWKFIPNNSRATDFNASHDDWITLSNDDRVSCPANIKTILNQMATKNNLIPIKNKPKVLEKKQLNISTKYRSKLRKEIKSLHSKLSHLVIPICQLIIDDIKQEKLLLLIDGASPGCNTFGQDHLIKTLKTLCENQQIPFVVVNPAYTSLTCADCGYVNPKKNRLSADVLFCEKCNQNKDAQLNGAKVVKIKGWNMWNNS